MAESAGTTRPESKSRRPQWAAPDTSGAIYGTLVATAVIAAQAGHLPPGRILLVTGATLIVFWMAHVYAETLAHNLRGARLSWSVVTAAMAEERPMLLAPVASGLVLLLGVFGILEDDRAVTLAMWAGVAQLVAWGCVFARMQAWGWPMVLLAGIVNGLFGTVIVILKAYLH